MGQVIAKVTLVCWGFVTVFTNVLVVLAEIPQKSAAIVSMILGLILSAAVGINLYRIHRKEGLDSGYFLIVRKGFWRILIGLTGFSLLLIGSFAAVFPEVFDELGENYGMTFAKLLIALFWFALISTFLGWALICFSEVVGYLRLRNFKSLFGSFALGLLWQIFSLCFSYLFLEVVNDAFFRLSALARNWILVFTAILTVIAGLLIGKYEDFRPN